MEGESIKVKRREDNISSSSDSSGFFDDKNIPSKHGSFSTAFEKQNNCMDSAIKSLDTLNEQIVQFIFTPKSAESQDGGSELTARERETLRSSMGVMRRLLVDAQVKFRKMVDDNRALAGRIDGSIQTANEEVNALRNELLDTNKRLSQLSHMTLSSSLNGSEPTIGSPNMHSSVEEALHRKDIPNNDHISSKPPISPIISNRETERIADLEKENSALQLEIHALHKDIKELKEHGESPDRELEVRLTHTQHDLTRALEAVQSMREDRKRLKAEKLDLLGQLKQLYSNLEDKESELRHFIRSYEQRMRETDDSVKQLVSAKDSIEQEKAEFLLRTQKAEQRAVYLQSQLETRQQMIDTLSLQLKQFREQLRALGFAPSPEEDDKSSVKSASLRDLSTTSSMNSLQVKESMLSSQRTLESHTTPIRFEGSKNSTPLGSMTSLHSNNSQAARDRSHTSLDQINEQSDPAVQVPTVDGSYVTVASDMHIVERRQRPRDNSKDRRRRSPGPFSRMFGGKTRSRRSIAVIDPNEVDVPEGCVAVSSRLSLLTQDNYQQKLSLVSQALSLPVATWRACHVLAWLEVDMNMPGYGRACGQNIKSGKVLLGLSDTELESALGLQSHLHRRKLRLAVEDLRDPTAVTYPKACRLDHTWVSHRLLPDLGLPQYCSYFEEQLVDGRLLSVLTRKDLEKHLCIQRKFHQASVLHAIELLQRVNFDKEMLHQRRVACENQDSDPIVWTNLRLLKWLRSIDLEEYTQNLKESGVHGAVLVLEPTFSADAFAAALGIPGSKSYVRRHLATELEALVRPARLALESHGAKKSKPPSSGGSLGRSFSRSFRSSTTSDGPRRRSLRGSFGRAFGRHKSKAAHSPSPHASSSDPSTQMTPLDVGQRSLSLELRTS